MMTVSWVDLGSLPALNPVEDNWSVAEKKIGNQQICLYMDLGSLFNLSLYVFLSGHRKGKWEIRWQFHRWEIPHRHLRAAHRCLPEGRMAQTRGPAHPLRWLLHLLQTGSGFPWPRHPWDLQSAPVWEGQFCWNCDIFLYNYIFKFIFIQKQYVRLTLI